MTILIQYRTVPSPQRNAHGYPITLYIFSNLFYWHSDHKHIPSNEEEKDGTLWELELKGTP